MLGYANWEGVVESSFYDQDLKLSGRNSIVGRAIVVHDVSKGGARVLQCVVGLSAPPLQPPSSTLALSAASTKLAAHLAPYPGYAGALSAKGTVVVAEDDDGGILMVGSLGGMQASAMGGVHIHDGYSCATAGLVGGHYDEGLASDPWATYYRTDASGAAQLSLRCGNPPRRARRSSSSLWCRGGRPSIR